jgi:hypothetical protein
MPLTANAYENSKLRGWTCKECGDKIPVELRGTSEFCSRKCDEKWHKDSVAGVGHYRWRYWRYGV